MTHSHPKTPARQGRDGFAVPMTAFLLPVLLAALALLGDVGLVAVAKQKSRQLSRATSLRAARAIVFGGDMEEWALAGVPSGTTVSVWRSGDKVFSGVTMPAIKPYFSALFGGKPFVPASSGAVRLESASASSGMAGLALPAKISWDDMSSPIPANRGNGVVDDDECATVSASPWTADDVGTAVTLVAGSGFSPFSLLSVSGADMSDTDGERFSAETGVTFGNPFQAASMAAMAVASDPGAWWNGQSVAGSSFGPGLSPRILRIPVVKPVPGGGMIVSLAAAFVTRVSGGSVDLVITNSVSVKGVPGGPGTVFLVSPVAGP